MGLLDDLAKQALGSAGSGSAPGASGLAGAVMGMLTNPQSGGLNGLVQSFTHGGLGDIVSSWVGTGANMPVTPQQIQSGFGLEKIQQLAAQAGLPADVVSSKLAEILPGLVDHLTPNGQIPAGGLLEKGLSFLKAAGS